MNSFVESVSNLLDSVAWPITVIVLVVLLRPHLPSIIQRLRKAGLAGIELDPIEQTKSAEKRLGSATAELKQLPGIYRSTVVAQHEKIIQKQLDELPANLKDHAHDLLVGALARATLDQNFALIYHFIYGSQIRALKLLHQSGIASYVDAEKFFEEQVRPQYPELYQSRGFNDWVAYLLSQGLVERLENAFKITDYGAEFLQYLLNKKLAEEKPG